MRAVIAAMVLLAFATGVPSRASAAESPDVKTLYLCNQVGAELSVAVAWDADDSIPELFYAGSVTTAKGWFHIPTDGCITVVLPTAIVNNGLAFRAQIRHTERHWSPASKSMYLCADEVNAFEVRQKGGKTCASPYVASLFYSPIGVDLDTNYTSGTWKYTFNASDVETLTPSPQPSPPGDTAFRRGAELFYRGRFAEAIHFFDDAIAADQSPVYYRFRAQAKFDLGHYEDALKDADAAVRVGDLDGPAFVGEAEWALGLLDAASTDYAKAAQTGDADPCRWIAAADLVTRAAGKLREAKQHLAASCKKEDSFPIVMYLRGELTPSALLARMKTAYGRAEAEGVIGFDLYLRRQGAQATPYLQRALKAPRIGPHIVPTSILREALAATQSR